MSWKESWNFIKPKGVQHLIGEQELTFYPISMSSLFGLRTIAEPVAEALVTLFQGEGNDAGVVEEKQFADNSTAFTSKISTQPVTPELAKFRLDTKKMAVGRAVDTLFDKTNARAIMFLIMDSLRDEFDRGAPAEKRIKEADDVLEEIDAAAFKEMLVGLYKGNEKAFGPLADMVAQSRGLIETKMRDLKQKINEVDLEDSNPETENPSG